MFLSVHTISRFYILETSPELRIYMSPLNIDPKDPALPVTYPAGWSKQLAEKWGDFKTLGWWHDTWALNEERIDEGVFLQDTFRTMDSLTKMVLDQIQNHPSSLTVAVYTSTDSVQHMFWRLTDPTSPRYDAALAKKYGDAILRVYQAADKVVGEVEKNMKPGTTLIIVSDHGFHAFNYGFNTNTWLVQNGSMELGQQAHQVAEEIRGKLLAFRDPRTNKPVLEDVYLGQEIDHGPEAKNAPDLQLNFEPGYRTSWETSLGAIPEGIVVPNLSKWSGDHCASDPKDTHAILFINRKLDSSDPSIMDVAPTVLKLLGARTDEKFDGKAWTLSPAATTQAER
jgi:predicted AlkP superfamily phosphohydrolase/phosphomutase